MIPLLITGCQRSGTRYMSFVMQVAGLRFLHEKVSDKCVGVSSAFHIGTGDIGVLLKNPMSTSPESFTHIWHQVRNPLHQISGFYRCTPVMNQFYIDNLNRTDCPPYYSLPRIVDVRTHPNYEDRLRYNMWYWLHWNKHIEQFAEYRYQLEEIPQEWPEIQDRMSRFDTPITLPNWDEMYKRLKRKKDKVSRSKHSWIEYYKRPTTWEHLAEIDGELADKVWLLGRSYGYDL